MGVSKMTFNILIFFLVFSFTEADVGFQVAGANENRTDFYILENSQDLLFPNARRNDLGKLKVSISGLKIVEFNQYDLEKGKWDMRLSDRSQFDVLLIENLSASTYRIRWHGPGPRELCVHYEQNNATWYSAYQSYSPHWPMDFNRTLAAEAFNTLLNFTLDEKKEDFYLILEHLFINTNGFAVYLGDKQPLFLKRNSNNGDALLCFSTNNVTPYANHTDDRFYADLEMYIIAANDIRHLTEFALQHSTLIPKPSKTPDENAFKYPTFSIYNSNVSQKDVLNFASEIEKNGFPNKSEILIDDYVLEKFNELDFSKSHFPDAKVMIETLHKRGFRVGVGVKPYLDNAPNHTANYFLKSTLDHKLTNLIDFSNPEAQTWYEFMLRKLHFEYGVDGFQLSPVSIQKNLSYNNPEVQKYPGLLSTKYIETVSRLGNKVISEVGYRTQNEPIFVKMSYLVKDKTSFSQLLSSLIPNALSLSIAGYSYFIPYQIGGFNSNIKPSSELYIRWVQAVTFMPNMHFFHSPWSYNNETVTKITKTFVDLHLKHAFTFINLSRDRALVGWPVIRPMWYLDPNDKETYTITDQYLVGDDLVVAPVLTEGQRERSVYLPKGIWIDPHGREFIGNIRITVKVPLEELAYFTRGREH